MQDIINNLKKYNTWKVQSTRAINIISSTVTDKECVMYPNSNNIEIMIYDKVYKVIK